MRTKESWTGERKWVVAELPTTHPDDLSELEIEVRYTGDSNCANAIPLDTYVIPLFKLAPALLEVVGIALREGWVTELLTDEEQQLIHKLNGNQDE